MNSIITDPVFSVCIKFGANMCNNGRVMSKNVIFSMSAAAILDFARYESEGQLPWFQRVIFALRIGPILRPQRWSALHSPRR